MGATFKIAPPTKVSETAKITQPGLDEPGLVPVTWRYKDKAGLRAWIEAIVYGKEIDSLLEVMLAWDVEGADGQPLACDRAGLEVVCNAYPAADRDLCSAYAHALRDSRLGNW
jgi:hypothetical protein